MPDASFVDGHGNELQLGDVEEWNGQFNARTGEPLLDAEGRRILDDDPVILLCVAGHLFLDDEPAGPVEGAPSIEFQFTITEAERFAAELLRQAHRARPDRDGSRGHKR